MPTKKLKILIIKVGYSETLAPEISNVTSYGDVLRSTVLLNLYKDALVTWLVDEKAYPILKNNPYIHRILIYNLSTILQLQAENFDVVINLEKVPGLCALADSINARQKYGFRFDTNTGETEAYEGTHVALSLCKDIEKRKKNKTYWQEELFKMVGAKWTDEQYILGYKPKTKENYDIGFNYQVGNKWPLKAWPTENWKTLEKMIGKKYSISWQQGENNIEEYFDWINSCDLIITNDSFGMHVVIALQKKLIALFGPTHASDTFLYDLGPSLFPKDFSCEKFPCQVNKCIHFKDTCMSLIEPKQVLKIIDTLLEKKHG